MFIIIIGLECIKIPYKTKSTQAIVFTILNVIIFVNNIERVLMKLKTPKPIKG